MHHFLALAVACGPEINWYRHPWLMVLAFLLSAPREAASMRCGLSLQLEKEDGGTLTSKLTLSGDFLWGAIVIALCLTVIRLWCAMLQSLVV